MALKFRPLADRVVVEPLEAEDKTDSGIYIPDSAKEKPQKGKIAAVGKGTKDHEMTVKESDMVIYGKFSGTDISLDGKDYLIMKESEILGVL